VFDNVAFPLVSGRHRFPRQEVHDKTMRVLRLVQLDSLADRPAPFLSGGQQQRVALARALVAEPTILLLDEPLSNLDAKLRTEMRFELKHLVKSLGVTTLYVTHDQMEALTMSDKVAVMQGGTFVEEATPKELYLRPRSAFTATFLGETNLIAGKVMGRAASGGLWQVETPHGPMVCPANCGLADQDSVWVACRPEGVAVTAVRPPGENVFPGCITTVVFAGDQIMYSIAVGEQTIQVKSDPFRSFQDGDHVFVQLPPERCLLIRRDEV
jgi:iron(III) transport system ATP-binding protein